MGQLEPKFVINISHVDDLLYNWWVSWNQNLSLTFHMLMISSITDEPLSWNQNLQEWCLWGSLQKLPSYFLDLTNTWLPWAILVSEWFPCLYGVFYTGFLILTSYLIPSSIWIVLYWFPNINKLSGSLIYMDCFILVS